MAAETCFFSSVFFIQSSMAGEYSIAALIVAKFAWSAFHSGLLAGFSLRCCTFAQFRHRVRRVVFTLGVLIAALRFRHIVVLCHESFPNLYPAVRDASPKSLVVAAHFAVIRLYQAFQF